MELQFGDDQITVEGSCAAVTVGHIRLETVTLKRKCPTKDSNKI